MTANLSRRGFLGGLLALGAVSALPTAAMARVGADAAMFAPPTEGQRLGTGKLILRDGNGFGPVERIDITYRLDGGAGELDGEAVEKLNSFFGDWRAAKEAPKLEAHYQQFAEAADKARATGEAHGIARAEAAAEKAKAVMEAERAIVPIDTDLFDLLSEVQQRAGGREMALWCGHRTPISNRLVDGAPNSEHLVAKAADISITGLSTSALNRIGIALQQGGVGDYSSHPVPFVHLDTGRVRTWIG